MPVYQITTPDGRRLRVTAPEGTTQEQALAYVQQQYAKPDFSNVQSRASTVPVVQAPSAGQRLVREVGLGSRAMLEGGFGTIGIVTDPLARVAGLPSAREGATALADTLGLPKAETPVERVGTGITEALTGGGGVMGLGRALATRAPGMGQAAGDFLSSQPTYQLASLLGGSSAAGVTREAGGSPGSQTLAGLVGGLSPGMAGSSGSGLLRLLARGGEPGRLRMRQGIEDFSAIGTSPSVGQATGNGRMQGLESMLAGAPTSAGVMSRAAERQAQQIGQGLGRRADEMFPNASAERAGRAIERGAETFAGNVRQTRNALYAKVDGLIPGDTRVPVTQTQQALAELTRLTPGAESTTAQLVNARISQIANSLGEDVLASQGQGIPYRALKELRSRIGEELTDFALSPDRPTAQYKRLYAALSQDMEQAARQQGPAAEAAMRRANSYMRASADRLEQVQRVVDRNGGPEKVFNAVMSGTRDGGTTLRAVMQSLPEDGQRAITAAVVKRMGLATPGQQGAAGEVFSAGTFLTNWNRLSPEARRVLFDRHGPQFARDMDKVARVAERIKTGSKVFANPSGSARLGGALVYSGSLATAVLTGQVGAFAAGAGAGGLANVMARALTNPRFVHWLAEATELPLSALPQQVVVLKQIAREEGDAELAEFAGALQDAQGP